MKNHLCNSIKFVDDNIGKALRSSRKKQMLELSTSLNYFFALWISHRVTKSSFPSIDVEPLFSLFMFTLVARAFVEFEVPSTLRITA